MRWLLAALAVSACLALGMRPHPEAEHFTVEAPQICTLDGISLSFTRHDMMAKLGQPIRLGGTCGYDFPNGLWATFADDDEQHHPLNLAGKTLLSRGYLLGKVGMPRPAILANGDRPDVETPQYLMYHDDSRHCYIYFRLNERQRVVRIELSRYPCP